MGANPLKSLPEYCTLVAETLDHPEVIRSTISVWSDSAYTGIAEGEVHFHNGVRLRLREEIDFEAGLISSYGYEVYRANERLYWYDDFPHPEIASLKSSYPHHKHVPPDIRHNRVPAPEIKFDQPNLPFILSEIRELDRLE